MNLIRNIALSLMLLNAVDASTTEDLVTSEGMEVPASFCPNHQEDFREAKGLFDANLELYKTRLELHKASYTQENCTDVVNARLRIREAVTSFETIAQLKDHSDLRIREAVASFETIAQLKDHPDSFYAAMILYHFEPTKYRALAIETCNNVLSQAGHKDTPAAGIVLEALGSPGPAKFDDSIVYNGPTPFKR